MILLFPSDPFDKRVADENYQAEYEAAQRLGMLCSLFSSEDIALGTFKPRPDLAGEEILYRGWMLSLHEYESLESQIAAKGARLITSSARYIKCHHLPEWYHQCEEFTAPTIFCTESESFAEAIKNLNWSAYFVKDFVKSLTTTRGSVAKNVAEIHEIVELIKKFRGSIEGGISIRKFEELVPESEERYFVFRGKVFSRDGVVPAVAIEIASRIDSPFFSIDLVNDVHGNTRLIELGDGQVSDTKRWSVDKFVQILI